ncbi:MAG: DCC1-like thiol-disulfide oxidoreductase family protein [Campylobacterota bacterium]
MKIEMYYDKECPFCNSYAKYIKLKESHELILLNARDYPEKIKYLKTIGFDINNGYIIKVDDKDIYQGVDAILFLNDLSEKRVLFFDNYFFRSIVYPFIKALRKIVLRVTKKQVDL